MDDNNHIMSQFAPKENNNNAIVIDTDCELLEQSDLYCKEATYTENQSTWILNGFWY